MGEKYTDSNVRDAREGWSDEVRLARTLAGRVEEVLEADEAVVAI